MYVYVCGQTCMCVNMQRHTHFVYTCMYRQIYMDAHAYFKMITEVQVPYKFHYIIFCLKHILYDICGLFLTNIENWSSI